ncbi:hypothetical protein [Streptomyces griseus]|uniref:hypothetical protein n=1 Tax=Streptomyces griseus TaxID=1911 RepID=UPI0004CAA2B2|nr:hypothetical protein [Streptomyces griseus]
MVRTRVKTAAVLTVVVLALTGFQTSSSGGGKGGSGKSKSKSSGGGGGCSSDKKDNDDYEGSGSGSGSGGGHTADPSPSVSVTTGAGARVTVVDCVEPARKKGKGKPARRADTTATLRIADEGRYGSSGTYRVTLEFRDGAGSPVDTAVTTVSPGAGGRLDFELGMTKPRAVDRVRKCVVRDVTEVPAPTGTPSAATASGTPSAGS